MGEKMPLLWCSISGHGFGHAAQTIPVVNALGRRIFGLRAMLRTTVPQRFFEGRLDIPWEISAGEQDIGCVQRGPLSIDVPATWVEYLRFHSDWEGLLATEAQAIALRAPALVLSNISYLAIAACTRVGLPVVALGSLSWDKILEPFADSQRPEHRTLISQIQAAYALAPLMIRLQPGMDLTGFKEIRDVHPVARHSASKNTALRGLLRASREETVVLVAFGGVPLAGLPFAELEKMAGYRFVVDDEVPHGSERSRSVSSLPLSFGELLASADIIVTKPGYSTIVEAVACRKAVVYVRRYNFADEEILVNYLHRHGRGIELSLQHFKAGQWQEALDRVKRLPEPGSVPPLTGAEEAAGILESYF